MDLSLSNHSKHFSSFLITGLLAMLPSFLSLQMYYELLFREGELGIVEPSKDDGSHCTNSLIVTTPLVSILTSNSSASAWDVYA